MAMGIAVGSMIDAITGNMAIWISLGISIGAAIGASLYYLDQKEDED
jgi:hypothetical protein